MGFLQSYEPGWSDFISSYQYALYRSWLQKASCREDTPAAFTSNNITKLFTIGTNEIKVEYDWSDFKITNQREVLTGYQSSLPLEIRYFLGSFLYRFNCADSSFAKNFLEDTVCPVHDGGNT